MGRSWYLLLLADEEGNDFTLYPYDDNAAEGYWFVKPDHVGEKLILKIAHNRMDRDQYGGIIDDSYEVLYEIPVALYGKPGAD